MTTINDKKSVGINSIEASSDERHSLGLDYLDYILTDSNEDDGVNRGICLGSAVIVAGWPGCGKSTIAIQMCQVLANQGWLCVYNSLEMDVKRIAKIRNAAFKSYSLSTFKEFNVIKECRVVDLIKSLNNDKAQWRKDHNGENPKTLLVIDSLNILRMKRPKKDLDGTSALDSATDYLREVANSDPNMLVWMLGQVTRNGNFRGPMTLQHNCDYLFELSQHHDFGANTDVTKIHILKNRNGTKARTVELSYVEGRGFQHFSKI